MINGSTSDVGESPWYNSKHTRLQHHSKQV